MKKIQLKKGLIALLGVVIFTSCGSRKDIVYFKDAKNLENIVDTSTFDLKLKTDDAVGIYVSTFDPTAAAPFNLFKASGSESAAGESIDYIIDKEGMIDFPVLGKIKVAGLSITETKALLKEKLTEYLKDPIINVRINNYRVSVLGEVNSPGVYVSTSERMTLPEALAMAGDLTIQGKRDNVLVIRSFEGGKTMTRVDLTNRNIIKSPVYYLTQNDVVYVEPNRSKVKTSNFGPGASILVSFGISIVTLVAATLIRNN